MAKLVGQFSGFEQDMAALEKTAENLRVEASEEKAQWPYRGVSDISCLDIGRG